MASSSPGLLRDSALAQNAYVMRTKCAQKCECDIFNASFASTYNFRTLKCTHFPVCDLNLNRSFNLNPTAPSNSCQFVLIRVSNPKLTETDRFRPKLPGRHYTNKPICLRSAGFQPAVSQTSNLQSLVTSNSQPSTQPNQKLNPMIHALKRMSVRCPFSLGEKVRMRDRLVLTQRLRGETYELKNQTISRPSKGRIA